MKKYIKSSQYIAYDEEQRNIDISRYDDTELAALNKIYSDLQDGYYYGEDLIEGFTYPFFWEVLSVDPQHRWIHWRNFGSSANDNTIEDLSWVMEVIFKTTPTEFLDKYIRNDDSAVDY